ncbi:hypothetical protein TNCV_3479831 [Trichonephila clavipes]|nr:hypothetical protein TNCV_3479831 [Trichonephila clavipes]
MTSKVGCLQKQMGLLPPKPYATDCMNWTVYDILPWSANSPDLSPVEHLQDLIGRDINRRPAVRTVDNLDTEVDVVWKQLPQATINTLIDRMSSRNKACKTARDGHIKY